MIKRIQFYYCMLVCALCVGFTTQGIAQTPQYYNDNSGTGNSIPFNFGTNYNYFQSNYGPGVFNSSGTTGTPAYTGNITTAYIYIATAGSATTTYNDLTIKMGQVNGTNAGFPSTTFFTGLTQVFYSSAFQFTGVASNSWFPITLQTPFLYDPTLALVVEITYTNNVSSGGHTIANKTTTGFNTRLYGPLTATTGSTSASQMCFGIDLVPAGPCTSPPTPGTASVTNANPCLGQSIGLSVTGSSYGTGQTFQWESATSLTGSWTPEGAANTTPAATVTPAASGTIYYRCAVTCGTSTEYTDTLTVVVPVPYPGGTYTVNSALPTGSGNFQSFTDAMSAIGCGITGPVVLNVAPGSGPYNEQLMIPNTVGTSSTSTLTINGNGNTVEFTSAGTYEGILMIDGADYVKIDSLNFTSLSTTYGFGAILYNGCDYDTITNCTFDLTSVTSTSSANSGGLRIASSPSGGSASATGASNTYIANCEFLGTTGAGGPYYGFYCYGPNNNNAYHNNLISNFYYYAAYDYYGDNITYSNNIFTRQTKTNGAGGTYGFYLANASNGATVINNRVQYIGGAVSNSASTYPFNIMTCNGTSTTHILIANNVISNLTASPYYGMRISGGSYIDVYHNTITVDEIVASSNANYGIYTTSSPSDCNIQNNLVTITGGGTSTKYGLYYNSLPTLSDNNDVYVNSTQSGAQSFGYSGSAQATLSAWQSATSLDALSYDLDPTIVFSGGLPYPQNPALDNLGVYVGINDDILGNARNTTTPDIGAIEFVPPTCPPSGSLAATNITSTSADLEWIPTSTAAQWQIEWGPSGFTQGTGTFVNNALSPYNIATLTPVTSYSFYVRDICGVGDTSIWVGPYTFTTACGAINSFPWTYDVETQPANSGSGQMTQCWVATPTPSTSAYSWWVTGNGTTSSASTGPSSANSGTNYFYTEASYGTTGAFAELETPDFDITSLAASTGAMLEFYYHLYGATTDRLVIQVFDGVNWNPIDSIVGQQQLAETDPWILKSVTLTGYTGVIRIKFVGVRGSSFTCDMSIDDISISAAPTCPTPSGLSALNITTTTADLGWTSNSTATMYEVEYAQGNTFTLGTGTRVGPPTATNPYSVSNLTPATQYSFFVRDICGPGDTSAWSPRYTFFSDFPLPPNDDCFNAIDLTTIQDTTGYTTYATQSDPDCNGNAALANDVWYSFTTNAAGTISDTVNTTSYGTDVVVQMYSGACGALIPVVPTGGTTYNTTTGCVDGPAAGVEWSTYTVTASTTYYVRVYGFNSAQGLFDITIVGAPLAIKLDKLSAVNVGSSNKIEWNTFAEERSDKFELERSADGKNFAKIYEKQANGEASRYTYMDNNPVKGYNYYRLRMTEANGNATYSEVVKAFVKSTGFEVEAYPNPVSGDLTVKVSGVQGADAAVQVTDVTGKVIRTIKMTGSVEMINMTGLANGIYLIKYSDANHTQTIRVNKQ